MVNPIITRHPSLNTEHSLLITEHCLLITEHCLLITLLFLLAWVRASLYAVIIPPWQAPDEPWHFETVVRTYQLGRPVSMADTQPFLREEILASMTWFRFEQYVPWFRLDRATSEMYQLPLYYLLLGQTLHWTAEENIATQLFVMRLASALLGAFVIPLVYLTVREFSQADPLLPLLAASLVAWLPMFAFITGSVNNDTLVMLGCSLAFWGMARLVTRGMIPSGLALLIIGLSIGLVSKRTTLGILPPVALSLILAIQVSISRKHRSVTLIAGGLLFLTLVLIGGSFIGLFFLQPAANDQGIANLYYNLTYGPDQPDLTDWLTLLPVKLGPYLVALFQSFWGNFGWLLAPLPGWAYLLLGLMTLLALAGLVWPPVPLPARPAGWAGFALASTLILTLLAFASYENVERLTFMRGAMPQARYLFVTIAPLAMLLAAGWRRCLATRSPAAIFLVSMVTGLSLDALSLIGVILPYFYGPL